MLWKTRGAIVCLLLAPAMLAGCGQAGTSSDMPWHALSLGPSSGSSGSSGGPKVSLGGGEANEWAVRGARQWRYIVIHHSASEKGSAASIDQYHREVKHWDGLGYHFVIDNGNGGPDGRVEVGPRWRDQKWGAHTGGTPDNEYNNYGIGICLIGDFTGHSPSQAQLAALTNLVSYLCKKYDIPPEHVIGHRDAPNAQTECPGDRLHDWVYAKLRPQLARQ